MLLIIFAARAWFGGVRWCESGWLLNLQLTTRMLLWEDVQ